MSLHLAADQGGTGAGPDGDGRDPGADEIEFRREVGRRLRAERARQGLSQHDLAAGAGLTRGAVGKIERGAHKVDIWRLHLLARVLGVEISVLLGERPSGR